MKKSDKWAEIDRLHQPAQNLQLQARLRALMKKRPQTIENLANAQSLPPKAIREALEAIRRSGYSVRIIGESAQLAPIRLLRDREKSNGNF